MVQCPACNTPLPEGARFCASCGHAISNPASAPVPAPAPVPVQPTAGAQPPSSGLAIAAFVCSLIPFCFISLVGLILGIVNLSKIRARPNEVGGRGLSIAAIVIGSIWTLFGTVGVLAAIAIPNFIKFQARAKQSEARAELRALWTEVEQNHETPGDALAHDTTSTRYTYYVGGVQKAPTMHGVEPQAIPEDLLSETQADDVVGVAVGNIDSDATLDVWTITRDGQLHHLQDDVTD